MSDKLKTTNKNQYWQIFIPKKFLKKVKGKNKKYFWILSFNTESESKEVYIPFSWLREDASGKGYYGRFAFNHEFSGIVKKSAKINSNEFLKFFTPEKMPIKISNKKDE